MAPLLILGGIAGVMLHRGRFKSRTTLLLGMALGVVLAAASMKWAAKRRGGTVVFGFIVIVVLAAITATVLIIRGMRSKKL